MAEHSTIEWTDATWNPVTGCSVVSPGCTNCYAMRLAGTRLQHHPSRAGLTADTKAGPVWTGEVRLNEQWLDQPLRWKRPRMIFVCAHGDLFHENVPDEWIDKVFAFMALAPQHTFQVLTKRAKRMREYFSKIRHEGGHCDSMAIVWQRAQEIAIEAGLLNLYQPQVRVLPNVWLGVSAERQQEADERIPDLLATPAAIRFISAEPLLGPIDFYATSASLPLEDHPWRNGPVLQGIDWIIVGGESGHDARPMHPDWARSLRDQCAAAGVPFFFKQWGSWAPIPGLEAAPYRQREKLRDGGPRFQRHDFNGAAMLNLGKKGAGRKLDGIEHNGMPQLREVSAL